MLSFDHATKLIGVPQAEAAPLLVQSVVNAIREEEASERGIVYDQIAEASGKASLGGGVYTGITLALLSTWKIEFEAGAYQATVTGGNVAEALTRVENTGNPQVLMNSSAAATLVLGDGGAPPTAAEITAAVWAYVSRTLTGDTTAYIDALAKIHGLVPGSPLTVTPTSRSAGGIVQTIAEAGDTVTVTRTA